jgi:hypothetical protein
VIALSRRAAFEFEDSWVTVYIETYVNDYIWLVLFDERWSLGKDLVVCCGYRLRWNDDGDDLAI